MEAGPRRNSSKPLEALAFAEAGAADRCDWLTPELAEALLP